MEREGKGDKWEQKRGERERDGADETLYKLQGDERKEILELRSRCNINFTDNPFDNEHCDPVSKLIQSGTVSLTLNCQPRMKKNWGIVSPDELIELSSLRWMRMRKK